MALPQFLDLIADDMARVDALIRARLSSEVVLIDQIGAHITQSGGKRLRPAMVLLTAATLGRRDHTVDLLATTIEFIHTATLLHDDVVDHSGLRRGRKTANALWGSEAAVLAGDFLYSRAFQLMVEVGRMGVMDVMANATNAIAEGEVLQLLNTGDPLANEARYLRVIELKTARLFEAACRVGALAADASPDQIEAAARFGHHLGMAFQLVDDVLDYIADPEQSGKAVGGDLAEGKPTLPLIHARDHSDPATRQLIEKAIEHGTVDDFGRVLKAIESSRAIPYTRALAEAHGAKAAAAADELPGSSFQQAMRSLIAFNQSRGS